jgi:hypothetical protein
MVVNAAISMTDDEITAWVEKSAEINRDMWITEADKVQRQILLGFAFFAEQGWIPGGKFTGLPYNAATPPTVTIRDIERGHCETVNLPCGDDILARITRQVTRFYGRMGRPDLNNSLMFAGHDVGLDWVTTGFEYTATEVELS